MSRIELSTWKLIAADETHPWYTLAVQALTKVSNKRKANALINKMLKH